MAGSPQFKVYSPEGEYVAACRYVEDAASIVAVYGDGATIRHDHRLVVWREGAEYMAASESCDAVADLVRERIEVVRMQARRQLELGRTPKIKDLQQLANGVRSVTRIGAPTPR